MAILSIGISTVGQSNNSAFQRRVEREQQKQELAEARQERDKSQSTKPRKNESGGQVDTRA